LLDAWADLSIDGDIRKLPAYTAVATLGKVNAKQGHGPKSGAIAVTFIMEPALRRTPGF
jgi:hypothetical protein